MPIFNGRGKLQRFGIGRRERELKRERERESREKQYNQWTKVMALKYKTNERERE